MKKTKIICTVGPACTDEKILEQMMKAGMNVARLNFSHGTPEEHKQRIDLIKKVRAKLDLPIAIMLDTKGPEYRTGVFENGKEEVKEGDSFIFTTDNVIGTSEKVSVSYPNLNKEMKKGDTILVNNGLLIFEVESVKGNDIYTVVKSGGIISDHKSMSFPGKVLKQVYLSQKDKEDLLFGIGQDIDFIACSFVSNKQDLADVRAFVDENGGKDISLIAKIENASGVENIEEICELCDGIMIARGDMGVEVPFEELPGIQKKLIETCRMLGKRVITATEMLETMITNPRPTRAEISDVANAVYDGTSAVMLSGETAAGKYPVLTVETMARIVEQTESTINYKKRFYNNDFKIKNSMDAVSHSVCAMSMDIDAKSIVVSSISGMTARMVSRFRSPVDILAICVEEKICRKLALSWGVYPVMSEMYPTVEVLFYNAKLIAKERFGLNEGDTIIITGGLITGKTGGTNTIRIETI